MKISHLFLCHAPHTQQSMGLRSLSPHRSTALLETSRSGHTWRCHLNGRHNPLHPLSVFQKLVARSGSLTSMHIGRHGDWLGYLYGAYESLHERRKGLLENNRANWTSCVRCAIIVQALLKSWLLRYPAGHVHIHEFLFKITDSGRNLAAAQHIYGMLYIITLVLSCAIYRKAGSVPNWLIIILPLSKRMHSIFVLRLFNDCWAVALVQAAILMFQYGLDDTGVLLFRFVL